MIAVVEILERYHAGDPAALGDLVAASAPLLKFLADQWHGIAGLAHDDILQEATLALLRVVPHYQPGRASWDTYLVTCVRRHLANTVRRAERFPEAVPAVGLVRDPGGPPPGLPFDAVTPLDALTIVAGLVDAPVQAAADEEARRDTYRRALWLIDDLPAMQQRAIRLRYRLDGVPPGKGRRTPMQVARRLRVTRDAAKGLLRLAHARLRRAWARLAGENGPTVEERPQPDPDTGVSP